MQTSDFDRFGFSPKILRGIAAMGWTEPRPIQNKTLPEAMAGRDVLGLAPTGTGKTGAFALPILESLLADPNRKPGYPRALIVAPTRELASQIGEEIRTLASFTRIRVAVCFGGVSVHRQKVAMKERPEIVVACPGRLLDLESQGIVKLHRIETLVLDEADHGTFGWAFLDWAAPHLTDDDRAALGDVADRYIGGLYRTWDGLRAQQSAPEDQAHALGWLGTEPYLALATRSLERQVLAPLRARRIPVTAA